MVKFAQRVKHAPGLLRLVRCRAEVVNAAAGEEVFVFRKADHTCPLRQMGLYVPCGGFRIAGHDRDGGLGGIMAVFHAGGLGAFAVLQERDDGLVDLHMAENRLQRLKPAVRPGEEAAAAYRSGR